MDVKTKDIAEVLSLRRDNVYRGKGPIDPLIAIEHARMYVTGEARYAGHLVARHSPLGWVIFGATPVDAGEANSILYLKYTMPEDLFDFWTTEAMGVAVTPCLCAAKSNRKRRDKDNRKFT